MKNLETEEQIKKLKETCQYLLEDGKIRFVGIINRMGRIITETYQKGITSLLVDKEDRMISMELALEVFLREEFDEKLGSIDYVLSKRKKVNLISIPIGKYLVLVSTEPNVDVDAIFKKTLDSFSNQLEKLR